MTIKGFLKNKGFTLIWYTVFIINYLNGFLTFFRIMYHSDYIAGWNPRYPFVGKIQITIIKLQVNDVLNLTRYFIQFILLSPLSRLAKQSFAGATCPGRAWNRVEG